MVSKAVTIVGWNATTYPMTVPASPFQFAVWGTFGVTNIPLRPDLRDLGPHPRPAVA